jgi:hypothetical protein
MIKAQETHLILHEHDDDDDELAVSKYVGFDGLRKSLGFAPSRSCD